MNFDDLGITPPEVWSQHDLRYRVQPEGWWPPLMRPCTVSILMVTDSFGTFGVAGNGLKRLRDALAIPPGPWVRFAITTANRDQDSTADIQSFRFDAIDLAKFDQIWMFAIHGQSRPLDQSELQQLAQYMDGGGGIFATGDHQNLGTGMCGDLLRVRSMRKWHWPDPGPFGEPIAPVGSGPERLDTLAGGQVPGEPDAQTDNKPQIISPRMYPSWRFWYPWKCRPYHPHPLLCGPRGVIRVLPDHPHEGECYVPDDLTRTFVYSRYRTEEYPALRSGKRLSPELIATSFSHGPTTFKGGPVTQRPFGAIGVWDGHRVDRGRVVVDATWHHFFNLNLWGFSDAQPEFQDITAYYRNIGVWLAGPKRQACMRSRGLWACRWHERVTMDLHAIPEKGVKAIELQELVRVGEMARDVLGHIASPCQTHIWFLDTVRAVHPEFHTTLETLADPWSPSLPEGDPDPIPWMQADMLLQAAIGGAIYAIAAEFDVADRDAAIKAEEIDWDALVRSGTESAIVQAQAAITRSAEELAVLTGGIGGSGQVER